MNPKARRAKSKARLEALRGLIAEERNAKLDERRDPHPGRARGWATR